jgi:hypothetical protein
LSRDPTLDALQRFLLEHVATYEELDVLLLLARDPGSEWTARSVADALGPAADDSRAALEGLAARGLLAIEPASATFRYAPLNDEVARAVALLETTYREQRATVAMMMSTNALERVRSSAIRTFAEAFRLKGPKT